MNGAALDIIRRADGENIPWSLGPSRSSLLVCEFRFASDIRSGRLSVLPGREFFPKFEMQYEGPRMQFLALAQFSYFGWSTFGCGRSGPKLSLLVYYSLFSALFALLTWPGALGPYHLKIGRHVPIGIKVSQCSTPRISRSLIWKLFYTQLEHFSKGTRSSSAHLHLS
jgi:hypothetical protein